MKSQVNGNSAYKALYGLTTTGEAAFTADCLLRTKADLLPPKY